MLQNAYFVKKWPKIEKKSRFFHFNHFCWQNWEYIQRNKSQNKKEGYLLISSKFDPIFKICQGCKIFQIFLNSLFPWWKMVLHTKFHTYSTKIEVPTSQNVVWPTIMAQTLDVGETALFLGWCLRFLSPTFIWCIYPSGLTIKNSFLIWWIFHQLHP